MKFTADRLLLFGATGDLSKRMLLPSLCALMSDGLLPQGIDIIGTYNSHADESQALVAELEQRGAKAVMLQLDVGRSDSFADFAAALQDYAGDAKVRMAALVCFDALLPLDKGAVVPEAGHAQQAQPFQRLRRQRAAWFGRKVAIGAGLGAADAAPAARTPTRR